MRNFNRRVLILVFLLLPAGVLSQEHGTGEEEAARKGDQEAGMAERMNALEEKMDEQSRRIEELEREKEASVQKEREREDEVAGLKEELGRSREEMEEVAMMAAEKPDEQKLTVYGFFDTTFYKAWFKKGSLYATAVPPYSTFLTSGVNLYFNGRMTDSLGALVELGLSFSPLGHETSIPSDVYVDGELVEELGPDYGYERVDTTVPGRVITPALRYGSVSIVRAYLDWTPRDWLKLRIGRYLTPYGIWNEEHAPTVLLCVFYPNMMIWDLVPPAQLGAQVFGSIFPADILQIDYALTVSNGRGPIDTIMDLDENKGVGLRLKAILSKRHWRISAGGYGYFGKYTNAERRARVYLDSDLSQDESRGSPLGGEVRVTEEHDEWTGAADLSVELYGVKLVGEYAFRRIEYLVHPELNKESEFIQNGDVIGRRAASHISQTVYGILAWTLPIEKIEPLQITPYAGYDWMALDDTLDWLKRRTVRFGLNVKPSPFVVVKTEGMLDMLDEHLGGKLISLAVQVAVSF